MLVLDRALSPKEQVLAIAADARVRKHAPDLEPAQIATWRETPVLTRDGGRPWVLLPFDKDPLRNRAGGYPLPEQVSKDLQRIARTGVAFHRLAVAHELAETPQATRLLTGAGPAGVEIKERQAARLIGKVPPTPELDRRAKSLDATVLRVLTLAGEGLAMAGSAALAPLTGVDPILFGVVGLEGNPTPGNAALYYPLVAWVWPVAS